MSDSEPARELWIEDREGFKYCSPAWLSQSAFIAFIVSAIDLLHGILERKRSGWNPVWECIMPASAMYLTFMTIVGVRLSCWIAKDVAEMVEQGHLSEDATKSDSDAAVHKRMDWIQMLQKYNRKGPLLYHTCTILSCGGSLYMVSRSTHYRKLLDWEFYNLPARAAEYVNLFANLSVVQWWVALDGWLNAALIIVPIIGMSWCAFRPVKWYADHIQYVLKEHVKAICDSDQKYATALRREDDFPSSHWQRQLRDVSLLRCCMRHELRWNRSGGASCCMAIFLDFIHTTIGCVLCTWFGLKTGRKYLIVLGIGLVVYALLFFCRTLLYLSKFNDLCSRVLRTATDHYIHFSDVGNKMSREELGAWKVYADFLRSGALPGFTISGVVINFGLLLNLFKMVFITVLPAAMLFIGDKIIAKPDQEAS